MESISVVEVDKLVYIEKKIEEVSELLQKNQLNKILEWARNDIVEIRKINRLLKEEGFIKGNSFKTRELKLSFSNDDFETKVMKLYLTLLTELENWRYLYLNLNTSTNEI